MMASLSIGGGGPEHKAPTLAGIECCRHIHHSYLIVSLHPTLPVVEPCLWLGDWGENASDQFSCLAQNQLEIHGHTIWHLDFFFESLLPSFWLVIITIKCKNTICRRFKVGHTCCVFKVKRTRLYHKSSHISRLISHTPWPTILANTT